MAFSPIVSVILVVVKIESLLVVRCSEVLLVHEAYRSLASARFQTPGCSTHSTPVARSCSWTRTSCPRRKRARTTWCRTSERRCWCSSWPARSWGAGSLPRVSASYLPTATNSSSLHKCCAAWGRTSSSTLWTSTKAGTSPASWSPSCAATTTPTWATCWRTGAEWTWPWHVPSGSWSWLARWRRCVGVCCCRSCLICWKRAAGFTRYPREPSANSSLRRIPIPCYKRREVIRTLVCVCWCLYQCVKSPSSAIPVMG